MTSTGTQAVVFDVEGTVSPLAAVREVLFPYARQRIADWVRERRPGTAEVVAAVRSAVREQDAPLWQVVDTLLDWHDRDRKDPPLKALHGLIWQHGFAAGELRAEIYPDVPPVLRRWVAAGVRCWVYSSGSVLAQRQWFRHTPYGDLCGLLSGHFDGQNAGSKVDPASYERIAASIGVPGRHILFLSDSRAELDAAWVAGWRTTGVSRDRDGRPDTGSHPTVADFAALPVEWEVADA